MRLATAAERSREPLWAAFGLACGVLIASIDTRPTWDDTGVTAGLLLGSAFVVSAISGRRPLLWGVLVGGPLAAMSVVGGALPVAIVVSAIALGGAGLGWVVRRSVGR